MKTEDVIPIIFGRIDALQIYWNLLIAVALGVLGILASGKSFAASHMTKVILSLGFLIFAASNCVGISTVNQQRAALVATLPDSLPLKSKVEPPDERTVLIFHVVIDSLVVLAIWLVPWRSPDSKAPD